MNDTDRRTAFRALHRSGEPLILPNIWDAGSARAVGEAGAKALATSSWAVAASQGHGDGEAAPLALVIANLERIAAVTDLPVTADFERGYGTTPAAFAASFRRLLDTRVVGCNLEDGAPGGGVRPIEDQAARIGAARTLADASGPGFFINARTDVFLDAPPERHAQDALLHMAVERARAYRLAGADGLFVPGLTNLAVIRALVGAVGLPINVMAGDEAIAAYAAAGVARISFGPLPYLKAIAALAGFAAERLHGR